MGSSMARAGGPRAQPCAAPPCSPSRAARAARAARDRRVALRRGGAAGRCAARAPPASPPSQRPAGRMGWRQACVRGVRERERAATAVPPAAHPHHNHAHARGTLTARPNSASLNVLVVPARRGDIRLWHQAHDCSHINVGKDLHLAPAAAAAATSVGDGGAAGAAATSASGEGLGAGAKAAGTWRRRRRRPPPPPPPLLLLAAARGRLVAGGPLRPRTLQSSCRGAGCVSHDEGGVVAQPAVCPHDRLFGSRLGGEGSRAGGAGGRRRAQPPTHTTHARPAAGGSGGSEAHRRGLERWPARAPAPAAPRPAPTLDQSLRAAVEGQGAEHGADAGHLLIRVPHAVRGNQQRAAPEGGTNHLRARGGRGRSRWRAGGRAGGAGGAEGLLLPAPCPPAASQASPPPP